MAKSVEQFLNKVFNGEYNSIDIDLVYRETPPTDEDKYYSVVQILNNIITNGAARLTIGYDLPGILEAVTLNTAHRETITGNPHDVTAAEIGLGNVDNTSDADKPVSTAQQLALDDKVDKVVGKELSANDFTDTLKDKLDGIENGAEVNNISDANAVDLTDGGETNLHIHDERYYTQAEVNALLIPESRSLTANTELVVTGLSRVMNVWALNSDGAVMDVEVYDVTSSGFKVMSSQSGTVYYK